MRRLRTAAFTVVALAAVAGAAGWALTGGRTARGEQGPVRAVATKTAEVVRTDIAERRPVSGTLGHAGTHDVVATGQGTLTGLPAVGRVVGRGDTAYEVDGTPVALLYGERPAWRAFQLGMTDGADVRQLERNLKALGHGDTLTVDRHFSSATYWAVRDWQDAAGLTVTGTVPLGQIVFVPGAVRIGAHDLKLGMPVQPGTLIEHGTGDAQAITAQLSPIDFPDVRLGDRVIVTLPDGTTRRGRITDIGAVAVSTPGTGDSGGGPDGPPDGAAEAAVPVTIAVRRRIRRFLDQAQVDVAITTEEHRNVLAVPTTALRSLPRGRYEVIVVGGGGAARHVPVEPLLFDETAGLAEVDAEGLSEGQKVEVPDDGA
jgi:peptidoglycan hydrolase-like protein with peptidoglycan-binding domain